MSSASDPRAIDDTAGIWVQRVCGGALSEAERTAFEAWRDADARHASAYERLADVWGDRGVWTVLAEESVGPHRHARAPRPSAWLLGAALLCAAAFAVWRFVPSSPAYEADFQTAAAEVLRVELPDGTRLDINGKTDVRAAIDDNARRLDLLRGEIFVAVAHEQRPLIVQAGAVTAEALGTRFNVDRRGGAVEVEVEEGAVRVTAEGGGSRIVRAGTGVLVSGADILPLHDGESGGWRSGSIESAGVTLLTLAQELSRYSERDIEIEDYYLRNELVAGRFSLDDPERSLRLIASLYDLEIVEEPDRILLRPHKRR